MIGKIIYHSDLIINLLPIDQALIATLFFTSRCSQSSEEYDDLEENTQMPLLKDNDGEDDYGGITETY